jgi:hypothetical protein
MENFPPIQILKAKSGNLIKGGAMCDRCTALEIAVSEQRMIIDAKDAELARCRMKSDALKQDNIRCREIIGEQATEIQRLRGVITRAGNLVENAQQAFAGVA